MAAEKRISLACPLLRIYRPMGLETLGYMGP